MEVRVKCKVKNLNFHELKRKIAQGEIADFTNEEYNKSASLRNAIRDNWVEVLKKARTTVPKPSAPPKSSVTPTPEVKKTLPGKKRGRKPKK